MASDKRGIRDLVEICAQHGLRKVVFSPGSRNAPLIISFDEHPAFECFLIADERSAAFVAMGMAQQLGEPVIMACTSGTAALNYAPAIAEAYYQKIPLLVITADRPVEWIDQGISQTIRQQNLFAGYLCHSLQFPQEPQDEDGIWHAARMTNEAILIARNEAGPVHINLPLREPLYGRFESHFPKPKIIREARTIPSLHNDDFEDLARIWNAAKRIIILTGQLEPDADLQADLFELTVKDHLVILTETTSNLHCEAFIPCIDRNIFSIEDEANEAFKPDLLLTVGGPVISKKIKFLFRKWKPEYHWHIDPKMGLSDTYKVLTHHIKVDPKYFFRELRKRTKGKERQSFQERWKLQEKKATRRHRHFLQQAEYSDLKVAEMVFNALPAQTHVQLANSTSVRYAQLFRNHRQCIHFANRGTSGIDGCTSTAVGAAIASQKTTTLITGDIAFFYDSNALWNRHTPPNLFIILINNSGGGIFRIINGPSETKQLEPYFEARHRTSAEHLAKTHNVAYFSCSDTAGLAPALEQLYAAAGCTSLLEIHTPANENDKVLKQYIQFMKKLDQP